MSDVASSLPLHPEAVLGSVSLEEGEEVNLGAFCRVALACAALVVSGLVVSCGGGGSAPSDGGGAGTPPPATGGGGDGPATPARISGVIALGTTTSEIAVELRSNGSTLATAEVDPVTGAFAFPEIASGTYEVVPVFADWKFGPAVQVVSVTSGAISLPAFAVTAQTSGNTPEELEHHDLMRSLYPFPGFDALRAPAARRIAQAQAEPAPGQARRDLIIETMIAKAEELACAFDKPKCVKKFLAGADPVNEPEQNQLAYLWGSEKPDIRQGPEPEKDSKCKFKLFGLDCNGLMYHLAHTAGIPMRDLGAWDQGEPTNWPLPPEWRVRLVKVPAGSYKRGDIVVWPKDKAHIGIATEDGDDPEVVSSTGSPESKEPAEILCANNMKSKRLAAAP